MKLGHGHPNDDKRLANAKNAASCAPAYRPLLVGEDNPRHSDPRFALYPYPEGCSGDRLCRLIMGLASADYLRRFARVNLCADGKWSAPAARARAAEIREEMIRWGDSEPRGASRAVAVLCGSKVAMAFGLEFRPFTVMAMVGRWRAVLLPHPSGRNLLWNAPGAFERARALLAEVGVL